MDISKQHNYILFIPVSLYQSFLVSFRTFPPICVPNNTIKIGFQLL